MEQRDYKQAVDSIIENEQLRNRIHDEVFKSEKNKKNLKTIVLKHKKITAAALILIVLSIPVSVIGARGIWQQQMKVSVENIGEYAMNYTFETVSDAPQDSDVISLIHVPVKLIFGYVPDGYVNNGNVKLSLGGKGTGGFFVIVYSVDAKNPLQFQGVSKITDTEINGRKAIIQERVAAWDSLLIFYDEYGYAVQIFYKDVSDEDLMKFGNGLELVQCASGEEGAHITDAKYSVPQHVTTAPAATTKGTGFSSIGDEVKDMHSNSWTTDLIFTVEDVQILDSFNGLDASKLNGGQDSFGEDGSILPRIEQQITRGDGINTVDTIGETITHQRKLVYLTIKCVNKSNKLLENSMITPWLQITQQRDGEFTSAGAAYPMYCDRAFEPTTLNGKKAYGYTIQPNETFEYKIAYLLTEEDLNKTLLVNCSMGSAELNRGDSWYVRIAN